MIVKAKCGECGNIINYNSHVLYGKKIYCSTECAYKGMAKQREKKK